MREMIKDAISKLPKDADYSSIWTMFDWIMELHKEARMEGFLVLEEKVLLQVGIPIEAIDYHKDWKMYNELQGAERFLVAMIILVCSGTDAETLREVAASRYFSESFEGTEALSVCIASIGVLSIRAGENPYILKERIYAILPKAAEKSYIQREIEKENAYKNKKPEIPNKFFEARCILPKQSLFVESFDTAFSNVDDTTMQRIIMDVDLKELAYILGDMRGCVRKRFFDNLSNEMARSLYEYMIRNRSVTARRVEEYIYNIFSTMLRLEEEGKICFDQGEYMENTLENTVALMEHDIVRRNSEIEQKVQKLKYEISVLEGEKISL